MRKSLSKKLLSAALALAVALSCIAFNPAKAQAEAGDTFDFQVLFTSDLHGCFGDWSYSTNSAFTGLGRLATEINRLKEENPDTVLLDMGDAIQGNGTSAFHTPAWDEDENNTYGMYPAVIGFETLGYDYAVLGNHEFNFGIARLEKAYEGFSGAVVSGNVFDENGEKAYDSYYIKDFTEEGGPRVAFIGMTHPNIVNWDAGNMTAAGYTVSQADEETAKVIEYLKSDEYAAENGKIDMFIATQHMGDTAEYGAGDSAESVIAMNGEDLSLFIGAHYHANVAKQIDGVWFAEVSSNGGRLGQVAIKATQTEDGWELANVEEDVVITNITVSNSAPVDPAYMEALKGADTFAKAYTNTVVGALEGGPLVPVPEIRGTYQAYFQDTALVHRINEAMLYTANEYVKRTPELAEQGKEVTLSGTAPLDTNANAQPGNLTRGAVSTIYKYDNNTLNITEMTGEQFKRWMEWAYLFIGDYTGDGYDGFNLGPAMEEGDLTVPYGNGNMPGYNMDQFLGLDYKVDLTRPYGERIVEMKNPDGTDFDLEGTYWVAVNNYRTDSQLRINAAEGTRPAVYPEGYDPAVVIAENIDAVLTVDGEDPVNNGEGMLGVMVDWINRVKGGTIDNEFTPNWEYITPEIDMEARAKAINLANAGVISMLPEQVGDSTGFNYARRSLTLEDVEGVEEILDIFSFNDFHGTVDKSASGSNPGADRFVAIVQTLMSENPNSVLLSAGDNYQGSPLSNLNLGGPVSDMIDYLGVEYGVPGNHEFDWGADLLPTFAEDGGLTFLAANIVDTETGEYPEYIEPYTVIEIGSKKVAFIGIANPGTPSLVKAENVEGLEFLEPGDWTNELIDELKEDNDLVIAFTHLDSYQDEEGVVTGSAATLAETCPGFDAIISGHSHRVVAGYVNDIPVVQGNYNGRGLARLTVVYSGDGFEIYPKAYVQNDMNTNAILPSTPLVVNADVKANIAEYNEAIGPLFAETAGVYGEDIDSREKQADWATRLVFDYIERIEGEPYVLIQNNGGWRDTSPYDKKADDEVTMGYLYTLMPFDNEIVLLEMRGKDLIYMLDLGVDGGGAQTEPATVVSAQCVAGAYKEDDTWFLESGDEIDPEDVYKVACNDFMLTGGDRYPFPGSSWGDAAGVEVIGESSFMGVPLRDAMVDQLIYRLENAEEVDGAA